ncbi:MAG: lysylphosphatidylglycerol synthase transmembrane domain-containing protein [Polyangiaceae bacterium]
MNSEPSRATVKSPLRAYAPRILASLAIAGGFVWLFRRGGLPLIPPEGALSTLAAWAIPAYVVFQLCAVFFRVHRWVPLLRAIAPDVSPPRVVGIGLVGIAAIMFAPLRMGEAARPYLLARDGKVSFFQALGAAGAERVIDGLTLTVISALAMALSTPLSPLPDHLGAMPLPVSIIPRAIYLAALVFSGGFIALVVFYGARSFARRVTSAILNPISPKLAHFVTSTLERLADGLNVLGSPKNRGRFFAETALYWLAQLLAQFALMRGAGIEGTFSQACVSLGVLGLGVIVPAGPGLFGAFQIGTYSGLALFFPLTVLKTSGAAMVFVAYASQLLIMASSLGIGFWILARTKPTLSAPAPAAASTAQEIG